MELGHVDRQYTNNIQALPTSDTRHYSFIPKFKLEGRSYDAMTLPGTMLQCNMLTIILIIAITDPTNMAAVDWS